MKSFSKRAQLARVSLIKKVAAEAHKDPDIINLSQGIPSFSTPKYIREGVAQSLLNNEPGLGKYTVYMGESALRKAIADTLSTQWNKAVDPEAEVFVSAGAMEGLLSVILALCDPGDEVVIPSPDYGPHFQHLHLAQAQSVLVPLVEEKGWEWDIDQVEKAITPKTKLILITNPGNPCGNVYSKEALKKLAALAKSHDLWVLVDETYYYLTYDNTPFVPSATLADFDNRLIIARSFSKEYAMTGWRLGFIYGPKEVISESLKMHDPMVIAASTVSQKAGLIALQGDQSDAKAMRDEFEHRRNVICTLLSKLSSALSIVKPMGSYYVFAHIAPSVLKQLGPSSEEFAFRMMKEAKVAVVPGAEFKPVTDEYIRFSFGQEVDKIEEGINRIKKWLL